MSCRQWTFFVLRQCHQPLAVALHVQYRVAVDVRGLIRLGLLCRSGLDGQVGSDKFNRAHEDLKLFLRRILKDLGKDLFNRLAALGLIAFLIPSLAVGSEQGRDSLRISGVVGLDESLNVAANGRLVGGAVRFGLCLIFFPRRQAGGFLFRLRPARHRLGNDYECGDDHPNGKQFAAHMLVSFFRDG